MGGRNKGLKHRIIETLNHNGFNAKEDTTDHSGRDAEDICNKCKSMEGLQLEISKGLREKMFMGLNRKERKLTSGVFDTFLQSIRFVLCEDAVKNNSPG